MRFLLTTFFLLSLVLGHSQTEDDKKLPGFTEVDSLYKLASYWQPMPGDSVFYYCDLIEEKAKELKIPKYTAWSLTIRSRANQLRARFDKAIANTEELIELSQQHNWPDQMINGVTIKGTIHESLGEYPEAARAYTEALRIADSVDSKLGIAQSYVNLGNVRFQYKRAEEGLDFMLKAAAIYEELQDSNQIGVTWINIGNMKWELDGIDSALVWYFKAYNYFRTTNDQMNHSLVLGNIALAYANQNKLDSALAWTDRTIALKQKLDDLEGLSLAYNFKGQIYKAWEKYDLAIDNYQQCLEIAKKVGVKPHIAAGHQELADVYNKQGKYQLAYEHSNAYALLKDTILNEKNTEQISEMQARFDTEKKDLEIKNLNIDQERKNAIITAQEQEQARKETQLYASLGGLGLLLLGTLFIFNRFQVTRKQKILIEQQKEEVEEQRNEAEHQKMMVEEKNKEIMDSITYAKRLQEAILPPKALVKEWLPQSFILYKPKDIVAGDFYWMENLNGWIYFAAADCTGHGVPGAMVSVVCSNALSKALIEEGKTKPSELLDRTRELVIDRFVRSEEEIKDGMDISLCAINWETREMQWAGANNPLWIVRNGAEQVEEIKADKQPIGKYGNERPFTNHSIQLNQGDTVYIFSDGYPDQFGGEKGKKYKSGKLKSYFLSIQGEAMLQQKSLLSEEFENWRGDIEQIDDVCIIGVRV